MNNLILLTDHEKVEEVLKKYSNEKTFLEASKLNSIKSYLENINKTFGKANSVEEIIFNLKQDNSDWSKKQLAILNKVSPTSLKVTFKAYQKGAKMSLIDCLKMEYRIVGWMYQGQDFFEGIRACELLFIKIDYSFIFSFPIIFFSVDRQRPKSKMATIDFRRSDR